MPISLTPTERSGRGTGGAPTISDVARMAGVAPMTVSRVINGEMSVRPRTRNLVNSAISTLNYAPNSAARSLAGAAPIRIGLLYSDCNAGFLSELLLGSLDQAARSDVQIVVDKCKSGDHAREVTKRLIDGGIDGIILPPPLCEAPAVIKLLATVGISTVLVASGLPSNDMLAIRIDDRKAAMTMMRHIMNLGHRRIGFITGNLNLSANERRLEGYTDALTQAGVKIDRLLIEHGLYTFRSGLDAAEELLDLSDPPTAIFASNDDMAAATVTVAHRRKLDVPEDLTVCGFGNTPMSKAIWPELTTIHQPIADMSRAAVELLVSDIRTAKGVDAALRHRLLDYTLIRRQSDSSPRCPSYDIQI